MSLAEKTNEWEHYAQLNKSGAELLLKQAKAESSAGDNEAAEATLALALREDPSLQTLYNEIGRLYAEKGETKASERCFHGFLPESYINNHFKQSYTPSDVFKPDFDLRDKMRALTEPFSRTRSVVYENEGYVRHYCAVEAKRSIAKPTSLVPTTDALFKSSELKSSVALVDQIPNGKLWFDGFNRMALDKSEKVIEPHTRGSTELLHAICRETEPYRVPGRCFLIGNRGFNNFCHWMVDILPSIGLFQQSGLSFKSSDRFIVQNVDSEFQRASLRHFGIRDEQIIQVSKQSTYIQADELIIPFFSNAMSRTMGSWIPKFLKSSFLKKSSLLRFTNPSPIKAKKIYLARPKDARNGRGIPNEPQLIEHLEKRGFVAVKPEEYSISEQAEIFAQADVLIAAHGAALTSIVFCRPGTSIIELYGDYMASSFWATSAICGLHYLNHYCGAAAEFSDVDSHEFIHELRKKGFTVDLNEIDQLLDLEEDTNPRSY